MPQFQLKDDIRYDQLDAFAKGYVEAMFFTNGDTGEDDEFLLNRLGTQRLTKASLHAIVRDCDKFTACNRSVLARIVSLDGYSEEQAGRDFWFSRQGHGVGYWDREALNVDGTGDHVHAQASAFGEAYVEVSRGWVHVH